MDVGSTLTGPTRSDGQTIVAAATLLAVGAVVLSVAHPQFESDTIDLAAGVDAALRCVDIGREPCPGVGAYSLQQTAIVAAAKIAGLAPVTIGRVLTAISGLSFALIVMFFAKGSPTTLRRLSLAALAAGPLVYYVRSSFGEMLATAALVAFVAAVRARRAHEWHGLALIAAAAWSASLGKDTLPAFVFLFGFVTVFLERRGWSKDWTRLAAAASGAVSGAATFSAFHRFRVGAWVNTDYVGHPEFFLDKAGDITSAFLGHWLSPSAGLVWFWPLAVVVFAKSWPRSVLPIGVVVAYAAGLALWWSPYGWIAWGDRLLYPMVCAAMFTCAVGADRNDSDVAAGLGPTTFVLAIALVSGAATSAVTADGAALVRFFAADARFPGPPTIQADVDLYREFLRHLTWQRRLGLAAVFTPLVTPLGAAIAGVVGVVSITLLRPRSTAKGDSRRDVY